MCLHSRPHSPTSAPPSVPDNMRNLIVRQTCYWCPWMLPWLPKKASFRAALTFSLAWHALLSAGNIMVWNSLEKYEPDVKHRRLSNHAFRCGTVCVCVHVRASVCVCVCVYACAFMCVWRVWLSGAIHPVPVTMLDPSALLTSEQRIFQNIDMQETVHQTTSCSYFLFLCSSEASDFSDTQISLSLWGWCANSVGSSSQKSRTARQDSPQMWH